MWRYVRLASALAAALESHHAEYRDYRSGLAHASGEPVGDPRAEAARLLKEAGAMLSAQAHAYTSQMRSITDGRNVDEAAIRDTVSKIMDSYMSMIRWAIRVRNLNVPEEWRRVYDLLSWSMDEQVGNVRSLSVWIFTFANHLIQHASTEPFKASDGTETRALLAEVQAAISTVS
jgi:hypothetical protein